MTPRTRPLKNRTMSVTITNLRVCAISLLAFLLLTDPCILGQDKIASPHEKGALARNLIGAWVYVGEPGKVGEPPAAGGRLKFISDRHWTNTYADPKTGLTITHHGGTYTLNGDEYSETIEYANESTKDLVKKTFKFTVTVEGDTLTMIGIGNPWKEVRKRLK